jgi:hypothetical protein
MKHQVVSTIFGLAFIAFVFSSSSGGRATAANSGNTGAPGETTTCVTCHNSGSSYNPSLLINLYNQGTTTPVTSYAPGQIYDMQVVVNNSMGSPSGYGFQMVALNGSNSNAGSWSTPSSNTKIATLNNGRSYVEQNGVGSLNTFTMKWTAPSSGTGNVTFYSAGNAVNGNGAISGDNGALNNLTINEMVVNISADVATNIGLADINNNGNGTDLQVTFNAAANENTISQYRIMIVKQANAASFNLAAAAAVSSTSYTTVSPSGNTTYSQTLSASSKDVNGANITNGQSYVAFVLSIADGTNANVNNLSAATSPVLVQGVASTATALAISDVANPGIPNVNVTFNKAANESTISEYRVMIVQSSSASSFDLTTAEAVSMGNYINLSPNGSANYTANYTTSNTDANGNALANGNSYVAFVLSIADGTNANLNMLSAGSSPLLLQTVAGVATNVMALDTNETTTGEDVLVYFDASADESTISEYRILMVKSVNASGFDQATASAVSMSNYTTVSTGNANYSTILSSTSTDVDGDAIVPSVSYQAFVLSVANGTTAGTNTLSTPSSDLVLNFPVNTINQLKLEANIVMIGDQLYISIDDQALNNNLQLSVFDTNGRLILQRNINDTETEIDMNAYSNGIYWVNLRSKNQTLTKAILK